MSNTQMSVSHPPEVVARIERLCAFHETTKMSPAPAPGTDPRPSVFRVFAGYPRVSLPTRLLDAPTAALRVMSSGLTALPESLAAPPQDLRTLASWLHLAAGITGKITQDGHTTVLRSIPSAGATYPTEIYVLALGIEGLEPGLYHFSCKDFSLYRLREGWEALAQLKRGRPDLEPLKTMPAVLLVSSIFCRSAWKYGPRAYRYATLDAGHAIENLVQAGTGLGIRTQVRMYLNERNTRELIGLSKDAGFDQYEAVQGFVAWSDQAHTPIAAPSVRSAPAPLPPIPRPALASSCPDHTDIRTAHEDCVAPGVALHEIRPPHTETCPLAEGSELVQMPADDVFSDLSLYQTMSRRRSVRSFDPRGISRDAFARLNRLAFRGGTYYPLAPSGPHLGLIRPFWFVHNVSGATAGLWYYHANFDQFTPLRYGNLRFDSKYLFGDSELCETGSAICVMVADLHAAMHNSCPDAYRIAHLEAGIAAQRLYLASTALNIECCSAGSFSDSELRMALDLGGTDWECLYGFALGAARKPKTVEAAATAAAPTAAPAPPISQNRDSGLSFK